MIIVFFYPRCHACSLSLERSLVDNLLFKMQTPVCHWQRNDVKRGDGKMCLQVLRWQYKINFKIPKCLSIDKSLPRVNSLKCASKTRRLLQILHSLRIFFSHCASVHFCWDAVFRIWFDSGNSKLLQTCFTWNLKEFPAGCSWQYHSLLEDGENLLLKKTKARTVRNGWKAGWMANDQFWRANVNSPLLYCSIAW